LIFSEKEVAIPVSFGYNEDKIFVFFSTEKNAEEQRE